MTQFKSGTNRLPSLADEARNEKTADRATTRPCLTEALDCAARGWHVFPAEIVNGNKKGCVSGKQNGGARWGATVDPDTIRRYWARFPDALLGVMTGPESGLFVVDVDTAAAHGADGFADLERWITEYGIRTIAAHN